MTSINFLFKEKEKPKSRLSAPGVFFCCHFCACFRASLDVESGLSSLISAQTRTAMKGYYRFTNERRKFFKERFIFNSQSDAVHMSVANILPDSLNIRDITLSNKDVISWLDSNSNPSNEPRIPVVWIRQEWEGNFQIDILESTQKLVLQRFKISEEFYNYVGHPSIQGFFRFPDDKLGLQSFAIALLNHCLVVWTYDPCTAQVNIVCWGKKKKLETLKSAFRWSSQTFNQDPMLPVIFVMMAHKQWLDDQLDEQFHNLTKVESRTQFAGWRLREKDIPDGSHTTLTAKMGGTAASLALCERNCFLGIQILTSMSYYSQQGQNDPAKNDTLTGLTSWARVLQQGSVNLPRSRQVLYLLYTY